MRYVKIYEVVYNLGSDGRMGDGIETFRTKSKIEADRFAEGKTCYSGPACVDLVEVPSNIAKRWGF